MRLEEEFRMTLDVTPPLVVGPTSAGFRQIIRTPSGSVHGARINGTLEPGADWLLVGGDGFARPDVRHAIRTDDGVIVYLYGTGLIEMNDATRTAIEGGPATDFGDAYLRVDMRLESGDARYSWVNHSLFVAEGRVAAGPAIEYAVYRIA